MLCVDYFDQCCHPTVSCYRRIVDISSCMASRLPRFGYQDYRPIMTIDQCGRGFEPRDDAF